ncbi:M23 family metallopeptidase [Deinococcus sp. QL22]|uniref:M23 family metallopeptidase n=1 Tax=Deinococcus sp. QL22 TaxID=2939437 RepID=UPI002016FE15|nr:M23 family metallopeptidase [Deinococcus sp. QL22]UQN05851.1 peptidoglycan DD-metalloendopeptidase family protein [Deinococcus sp. QL22]
MTRRVFRRAILVSLLLLGAAGAASYTVKAGDTLYSVARANSTTVAELTRVNRLTGTTLEIGQVLTLPGSAPSRVPSAPAVVTPAPITPAQPSTGTSSLQGVTVRVPASLRMGEGFTLRLSGARAGQATVRFPSELGEDVRRPAEVLKPVGAAGEFVVPGRVVLGKTTPVVYEVSVGGDLMRGRIPVTALDQPIQHLNLPNSVTNKLQDPARAAEEAAVEKAYARRTPQVWSRPFAPALATARGTSSGFGQPRTYKAGGPVAYHYGTDFPAPSGTPILAVNDGTVVIAGKYPVRGGLVVVDHGAGVVSMYFHQSRVLAKVGQKVTRGEKIGEVGTTGLSAGPHLHLEVRVRGEATNPSGWMNRLWPR